MRRVFCATTVAAFLLFAPAHSFAASSPSPTAGTQGSTDPRVTQGTISTTICKKGYTTSVRDVGPRTKSAIYRAYGISKSQQRNYVIDHLIPLEVGGSNYATNLWPQTKGDAKAKDKLENSMHAAVCLGSMTLADAQAKFLALVPPRATVAPTTTTSPPTTLPPTTAPPATAPPTEPPTVPPTEPPAPAQNVVHPGAFCAPAGATGVTTAGTPMVCGAASDGRNRWIAA
jgi:hypothetical protein